MSCRDSCHFWVNEGFTVKLERRILSKMYGPGLEGLAAIAGRQTLDEYFAAVGEHHKTTSLVTKLKDGEDPDDYFSCVSYEKGYNFLLWLEHCVKEDYGADFHGKCPYAQALFPLKSCFLISNAGVTTSVSGFVSFLSRFLTRVLSEVQIPVDF